MRLHCQAVTVLASLCVCAVNQLAYAAPGIGRFEPTDLHMAEPGELELDTQVGVSMLDGSSDRLLLPDFELNLGLTRNVELDIDGSFAMEHFSSKSREYLGEPLWVGVKLGLADWRDDAKHRAFALGLQLGPLLPTTNNMRGVGYGGLVLAGLVRGPLQVVFNAGALYAPRYEVLSDEPPARVMGGIDLYLALDNKDRWALLGELGGSFFWKHDFHELSATAGVGWNVNKHFALSAIVLCNALDNGERVSFLVGVTPKLKLW